MSVNVTCIGHFLFDFGAVAPLEGEYMPELTCPNCRAKFEYKKTDNR